MVPPSASNTSRHRSAAVTFFLVVLLPSLLLAQGMPGPRSPGGPLAPSLSSEFQRSSLPAHPGTTGDLAATTDQAQEPDGKALYREHCRSCHGANGVPPQRARDEYEHIATFADSVFMARRSDDSLVAVIRRGTGKDMKSFREKMSAEEMRAVAQYIRAFARRRTP